ncbi:hypothetical protein SAMN04489761_1074 [Tenacibaculum sp. MAR_2009_124]|uniref:hypothetical protein n=1 Tax=Tenacibaculum sp. MAR_2009_124 TaxID=1250059 RepID=UPI000899C2BC|nr:hypothetical protein [Tenacibaculum sp. MAR_2009_124]SEB50143.1 hypothetical protein SAMN04489761_1074 [Tenacibaculum sp. MAR_2009_124]
MLKAVNIKKQLIKARSRILKGGDILSWVQTVFNELDLDRNRIKNGLESSNESFNNNLDINKVNPQAVFHINQIKKICVDYRLRFLTTGLFKGDYPEQAVTEIRNLERRHHIQLKGFKIMARSRLFKLKETDDPLLFVPLGNDYYYLIYQWGNDLHPLRKLKFWPAKNVRNLGAFVLLISFISTIITHSIFFGKQSSLIYGLVLFLFYLKGFIGGILFFGISSGKNFSEYCWQSPYNKIS